MTASRSPARSRFVFEKESVQRTKVEFVGNTEFLSLSREVASRGDRRQAQTFDSPFKNVEKAVRESPGHQRQAARIRTRYFIRVTISRRMADVVKERDIWVHSFRMPPDSNNSIKMEVGIEGCLHIEFEYNMGPTWLRLRAHDTDRLADII
ncbi:vacuolar protein sorting-associated protein 26-domain-containing protein [Lactarius vividus]|nr:vacuolar protein sorting-associated protein 26-domain-containing protein [Lactarius vividus]